MDDELRSRIYDANKALHRAEAKFYDRLHSEIYSTAEQRRVSGLIDQIGDLILDNHKKAMDFGAGTGNITGKLLERGYRVTAVDISREMCDVMALKFRDYLSEGKLEIINSKVEDIEVPEGSFDLIACYSVLHHLPDYLSVIHRLSKFLKKGGVMYLDHEVSPSFWDDGRKRSIVRLLYLQSSYVLSLVNRKRVLMSGGTEDSMEYSISDYWANSDHHLDHEQIKGLFQEERYESFERKDYHLSRTKGFNPFFPIYKLAVEPDTSCWVARK